MSLDSQADIPCSDSTMNESSSLNTNRECAFCDLQSKLHVWLNAHSDIVTVALTLNYAILYLNVLMA